MRSINKKLSNLIKYQGKKQKILSVISKNLLILTKKRKKKLKAYNMSKKKI